MKSAADKMSKKIIDTSFNTPEIEIINNVTAMSEKDPKKIKELLINQIFLPLDGAKV